MDNQDGFECSVWNNGGNGWGFHVLGGLEVRQRFFRRNLSPVRIELDGVLADFNVDKPSFWKKCPHLINGPAVNAWIRRNGLHAGDHLWLEVVKPYQTFRAVLNANC